MISLIKTLLCFALPGRISPEFGRQRLSSVFVSALRLGRLCYCNKRPCSCATASNRRRHYATAISDRAPALLQQLTWSVCIALLMICCSWYSAAMAQTGDGDSALQLRVRLFLEAPLGTAVMAPLAVRAVTDGPELKLVSRGVEATTQVEVVIYASDPAAELMMMISTDAAGSEVVTVPSDPIVIPAVNDGMMRRIVRFELTAKEVGEAIVFIAVTGGGNEATTSLRIEIEGDLPQSSLTVIEPQPNTELRLLSHGAEATTQVQVVIEALDSAAELRMTISVDDAEVATVSSSSITIVAADGRIRRNAQFELRAKTTGETTVRIAVTDGASMATVALRVVVAEPSSLQILSPSDGTQIVLARGDGSLAATQVEVVIVQQHTEVPILLNVQLERVAMPPVFISLNLLTLTASADGSIRTRFTLAAAEAGNTTLTLVVSDRLGNRAEASVRVSVVRLSELCEICLVPDMFTVSSGTFTMGSPADEPDRADNEEPQHPVRIGYAFAAGKYELTRGQYRAFVDASGYDAGDDWQNPDFTQNDAHPVVNVSWEDAKAYLAWLSEETGEEWRLLSEAEWEYATRAGTTTSYSFGNTIDATQARFDNDDGTVAAGSYAANAFGLHDMHGNVYEWVEDCWHDDYSDAPTDGSAWLSECDEEDSHVLRGGAWDSNPRFLRSADRDWDIAEERIDDLGFRVARTLESLSRTLAVIEPQTDTELRLLNSGVDAMAQVQVVIDAIDTAADLRMTVSTDMAGAEVVEIPSDPIIVEVDDNARRRSAEFELIAKTTGTAAVTIAVTDGVSTATVVLRIVVAESLPLQILSPSDGTEIALARGDGSLDASQVEVILVQPNIGVPIALDLQLEGIAGSPVFISTTSLTLASADGNISARFTLAAAEAGNTTLTLVASDRLENREEVSLRVSVERVGRLCASCLVPDMITVPAGTFTMGSPSDEPGGQDDERPQHQVNIGYAFAVGQYELTHGQYRAFVDASGYAAGNLWLDPGFTQNDAHPVVRVSWDDAKEYISWLSEQTGEEWRLLSEAEWEYAARAGTTTNYAFGDTINATQARFDSTTGTVAVGSYAANEFALYDMHGNVWEWVEDCWHSNYNEAPTDGSAWVNECTDARRMLRGGSWGTAPGGLHSANRDGGPTGNRNISGIGFRVARTLKP